MDSSTLVVSLKYLASVPHAGLKYKERVMPVWDESNTQRQLLENRFTFRHLMTINTI